MSTINMRAVLGAAILAICAQLSLAAQTADYPTRPLRYVVAFAPGGINDIMARIVAQKLNESWGQPVIVDNRPGAGGNLAAELVSKTTPDGYTFMNISTAHTIAQTLYRKLNYSLERDLTPVVVLGTAPLIMVVNPGIPAKNVSELVAWAKKNRLIYASGGAGVISHLSMEMFKVATGIDATHVPYKGVGPAVPDLVSGQAHVMINAVPELFPHAKGGRLRIIGTLTEKRHPFMPEVPTMIEQGYKEFVMGNWTGIVAPAKTPKPVITKLATEITRIIRSPEYRQRQLEVATDIVGSSAEHLAAFQKAQIEKYRKIATAAGIKPE